jgi:hypothetical protein
MAEMQFPIDMDHADIYNGLDHLVISIAPKSASSLRNDRTPIIIWSWAVFLRLNTNHYHQRIVMVKIVEYDFDGKIL